MGLAEHSDELVAALRAAVYRFPILSAVLAEIARIVGEHVPHLKRVSVRLLEGDQVRIAGLWSARASGISEGLVVSALATSIPELSRERPVVIKRVEQRAPVLDDVLQREGIYSWVSMALTHDGVVRGALSISSGNLNAFAEGDSRFFTDLAAAVEERLLLLASVRTEGSHPRATD